MSVFDDSYFMNIAPEPACGIGFCRLVVQLDGEKIQRIDPHIGFSHRGIEKLMEKQNSFQALIFCSRLDRATPFAGAYPFVLAVEKLLGVQVPVRAKYIRVMLAETARILSHLRATANLAADTGTDAVFPIVRRAAMRITSLLNDICAGCPPETYFRAGGVKNDLSPDFAGKTAVWLDEELPPVLSEIQDLLTENRIFKSRTQGIGRIDAEDALDAGFSGVNLRASGVKWDVRVAEPYDAYDKISFDIPSRTEGDCYARYLMRIYEIFQSMTIVRQIIAEMPGGRVIVPEMTVEGQYGSLTALSRRFRMYGNGMELPQGEVYVATESPLGELGVYLVCDGSPRPYRCHFRSAGLPHLQALNHLAAGYDLADVRPVLSSLNIIMTEVDR